MQQTPTPKTAVQRGRVPGAEPILSVQGLKTHFTMDEGVVRAVDGVSFNVYPGEVVGIVGESGCGKSITMKSVLRLIEKPGRIVSGSIMFRRDGQGKRAAERIDLAALPAHGRRMREVRGGDIALIPQEPMASFSPLHSIGSQIVEAILLHQTMSKAAARALAIEKLREVGVPSPEQRFDAFSWQLSGGLRQRAIIAMALSCNPAILIADEPTTAIDVTTQAQVLNLLKRLQDDRGSAIVFITHDLGVIAQLADHVVVMYLGKVVEEGPVRELFHHPQHPYTRALLRSVPSVHAEPRVELPTIAGGIPHPLQRPAGCPFHPRCPDAIPGRCDRAMPALLHREDGAGVACFLHGEREEVAA